MAMRYEKSADPRRMLEKATGLLLSEMDRSDRAANMPAPVYAVRTLSFGQPGEIMQGKQLFLNRAASRTADWQCRFASLSAACHSPKSASGGRQLVAATTDSSGIRCVFFSSIGSIMDFRATWDELSRAGAWWHFVCRWHYWAVPTQADLLALGRAGSLPEARAVEGIDSVLPGDDRGLLDYLDRLERRFRRADAFAPACAQ
jgi:hypothetical protein